MLTLAMDTATPASVVALVDSVTGRVVHRSEHVAARGHGEHLAPLLAECLAATGREDVGLIVAGRGPGPFTGLRVGLVTARTLGFALEVPVVGICTHDALAEQARASGVAAPLLVVTDALRREVYWSRYDALGRRVQGPAVSAASEVPERAILPAIGAGAQKYRDAFGDPLAGFDHPDPAALARLGAAAHAEGTGEPADALYLRRPDAQANPVVKSVLPR